MSFFSTRIAFVLPFVLFLALACSQAIPQPDPASTSEPTAAPRNLPSTTPSNLSDEDASTDANQPSEALTLRTPTEPPPKVDRSTAIVPLEDVLFDTFRGGFLRLSEATDSQIEGLRDSIKPIYVPTYDSVEGGDWLNDSDLVMGYVGQESGQAFAYPIKMLNLHEIVNDVIDGVPVLISYCPLCASGVVYGRELDGQVLLFGNTSALYESDLVMYDHETGSYWFQVLGEAIVGPLSGKRLTLLPSSTIEWGDWKELHPETQILSRNIGLLSRIRGNPYDRDPFVSYQDSVNAGRFAFPVSPDKLDSRLRPGDRVFAVQIGDTHKAYFLDEQRDSVINDEIEAQRIVVFIKEDGPTAASYISSADGQDLTFSLSDGVVIDTETGSQWDHSGRAISGPLAGKKLTPVPSRTSFWFSLVASLPDIGLYLP